MSREITRLGDMSPCHMSVDLGHTVSMPSPTRRILSAALGAAFLMSACSSGDDDAAPSTTDAPVTTPVPETIAATTTDPTTTTTAPTTTAATTTTVAPTTIATTTTSPTTTTPPPTTNPGDPDWVEITQGLLETLHDINEEPDADRIAEFCLAGENGCQSTQGDGIRTFVQNGWRTVGVPHPVVLSRGARGHGGGRSRGGRLVGQLRVRTAPEDLSDAEIVDSADEVVFEVTGTGEEETLDVYLVQTPEGWRVLGLGTAE